jgi:outer membrane putative beta-barrel porin/alpha-amylase
MNAKLITIIILITLPITLLSQSMVTDRPDQTESSSTVSNGSLQIESGLILMFHEVNGISQRNFAGPSTLFRVGLTDIIELRVFNQLESNKEMKKETTITGISDLEIGAKVQLFKRESVNTEIAFLSHLVLPSGTRNLSGERYGSINKLAISHELFDKIGLGYNIGYNYLEEGSGDLTYSIATGYGITDKLSVYIEGYGELVDMSESYLNFDAGFTYLIKKNLQADFSFGTGINHYMNYYSCGISWNIARIN